MRPDNEREVWVLLDGAMHLERPPRAAGTPGWAFTADSLGLRVTNLHHDREGAAKDLEEYAATPLGSEFPGRIWSRAEGKHVFHRAEAAEAAAVPNS